MGMIYKNEAHSFCFLKMAFNFTALLLLMKPKLSLLLLLLSPFFSFAQQKDDAFTIKQFTIDAGFTGVQLGSELATGKVTSVQFRGGVLPLLYHPQDEFTEEMKWVAGLSFSAEYRFYYNFEKRLEKGKEVTNNGANYISLFALYGTKPLGKNKNLP